jgi:hypothetical protein
VESADGVAAAGRRDELCLDGDVKEWIGVLVVVLEGDLEDGVERHCAGVLRVAHGQHIFRRDRHAGPRRRDRPERCEDNSPPTRRLHPRHPSPPTHHPTN